MPRRPTRALALALLAGCAGAGPEHATARVAPPASAPAVAVAPPTPSAALPPAARAYVRGTPVTAVVDERGPFHAAAVSPDGLLVALVPRERAAVLFYDLERRRIVGRASSSRAMGNGEPRWIDDGLLEVSTIDFGSAYDGRRGLLLGRVPGARPGIVSTAEGPATLRLDGPPDEARLVPFAQAGRELARVHVEGYVRQVLDLGGGAFAYDSPAGVFAFDADGQPSWSRAPADSVPSTDGSAIHAQSAVLSRHEFHAGHATVLLPPDLVELWLNDDTRAVEHVGGTSFAGRCQNGATALLGPEVALPSSLTQPSGPPEVRALTTSDGAYHIGWQDREVTVTRASDGSVRVLDPSGPVVHVALHPNGRSLVTAAHLLYVGMAHIGDPAATVSVFDPTSGARLKAFAADDFAFSADGRRLLVYSHDDTALYDAATYQKLRSWPGLDTQVFLGPTNRFALVYVRPPRFGPLETTEAFVEELGSRRRVVDLEAHEGRFAFDTSGSRLAFGATRSEYLEDIRSVSLYDLGSGKATETIEVDEPVQRLAFLDRDRILALSTRERVILRRLADARELSLYAVPDGPRCRLFALDEAGHWQGDPGTALGFRHGDDLRTSELVTSGPDFDARRDDTLVERLFAEGP